MAMVIRMLMTPSVLVSIRTSRINLFTQLPRNTALNITGTVEALILVSILIVIRPAKPK